MTLGEFKSWLLDEHKLELKNWAFVRMLASTLKSEQLIVFEQMNRVEDIDTNHVGILTPRRQLLSK